MPTTTYHILQCPVCFRELDRRQGFKRKYGPTKVICKGCGALINTNLKSWLGMSSRDRNIELAKPIAMIVLPVVYFLFSLTPFFHSVLVSIGVVDFGGMLCFSTFIAGMVAFFGVINLYPTFRTVF